MSAKRFSGPELAAGLEREGFAVVRGVVDPTEAADLAALFDDDARFRSTVDMARHGYGSGCYRYLADPLPDLVARLRAELYDATLATARAWSAGATTSFPETFDGYRAACHAAGQTRPTPLLLRYGPGDHNRLHADRYGDLAYPFQATVLLSSPENFDGGELILVENRPRSQARAHCVVLGHGDAVVFPNTARPAPSKRGTVRTTWRHGVSTITAGERVTLGLIVHDAA